MDKPVVEQFLRVEKALATLINSISTYNPNPTLAQELIEADGKLNDGLEQLEKHQANYARIQHLRATSSALDASLKTALQLLSTTRADLLATPATTFPSSTYPVAYTELIAYARRISKFTLPPSQRFQPSPPASLPPSQAPTNGTATPVAATPPQSVLNGITIESIPVSAPSGERENEKIALPPHLKAWLNPSTQEPDFVPWPTEEVMRRGALANLQVLRDQGVEAEGFDPVEVEEREREQKRLEEEAEKKAEEEREKKRVEEEQKARERAEQRRKEMEESGGNVGVERPQGGREEKKPFNPFADLEDSDSD